MKRRLRDAPAAVLMLGASLTLLGVWTIYPLIRAIQTGHLSCDQTGRKCTEKGWGQYLDVFQSKQFQDALMVSVKLAVMTVPIGLISASVWPCSPTSTCAASASSVPCSPAPWPPAWRWPAWSGSCCCSPRSACCPICSATGSALKNPGLLRDPDTALPAVALSSIWASLGFTFIVITAGLQSVPKELYESAYVDGAGSFRRFTNVTLPMLSPSILFISVVLTTRALQTYGEVALLTGGGPEPEKSTTTIPYLIYGRNSIISGNIGLKSAAAVLLFLISLVFALVQFRGFEKRVHYGN